MRLKNILIVVSDIERSKAFYKELFNLDLVRQFEGNVILTQGLVLQDKQIWEQLINRPLSFGGGVSQLYFETGDLEAFQQKLDNSGYKIEYLSRIMTYEWGQKVIRLYDPDRHVIEIGENYSCSQPYDEQS